MIVGSVGSAGLRSGPDNKEEKVGEKDARAEQKTEILCDLEIPPAAKE
jgi:hypothetical protein